MRLSTVALPLLLAGCKDGFLDKLDGLLEDETTEHGGGTGPDTGDTGSSECRLVASIAADCPTDACPAIAHADALVDLRTTVLARVVNAGGMACDPVMAELSLDGALLQATELPSLAPGEETLVYNTQSVFTQTDTSAPSTEHTLALDLPDDRAEGTFTPRVGVGCFPRGLTLAEIEEHLGVVVADCTEPADASYTDLEYSHPYCGSIEYGKDAGWVDASSPFRSWECTNIAEFSKMVVLAEGLSIISDVVCPDVDPTEWYAPYVNTLQSATGALADTYGNCNPGDDLIRPMAEEVFSAL